MSENRDNEFPRSEAAKTELIRTDFPKEKPIFWGPKQDTTYPDTYNEPSGWREKELLRIPEVVRLIHGFAKKDIKRTIYIGSVNYSPLVQERIANIALVHMPILGYAYQEELEPVVEIREKYNASKSTMDVLKSVRRMAHTSFSVDVVATDAPDNTLEHPFFDGAVIPNSWRGGLASSYHDPFSGNDYPFTNLVDNTGSDMDEPTATLDIRTQTLADLSTDEENFADYDTDNISGLSVHDLTRLKCTLHFYIENIIASSIETNKVRVVKTLKWGGDPPHTGDEFIVLNYTYTSRPLDVHIPP